MKARTPQARRPRRSQLLSALAMSLAATLIVSSCSALSSQPRPADGAQSSAAETADEAESSPDATAGARITSVSSGQWRRMVQVGMWRPGCPATRKDLRRVEVNHWTFDGDVRRGVLVVNQDVAGSVAAIFTTLFEERFPIRRMRPVEAYRGDANASLADDNTSAYNCRRLDQINAPPMDSPHANGRAIDINPLENPWKDLRCKCWFPSKKYAKRVERPGTILKGGLVWRLFRAEGWVWQNIKVPDYMHFDTGYPSRPYQRPSSNR